MTSSIARAAARYPLQAAKLASWGERGLSGRQIRAAIGRDAAGSAAAAEGWGGFLAKLAAGPVVLGSGARPTAGLPALAKAPLKPAAAPAAPAAAPAAPPVAPMTARAQELSRLLPQAPRAPGRDSSGGLIDGNPTAPLPPRARAIIDSTAPMSQALQRPQTWTWGDAGSRALNSAENRFLGGVNGVVRAPVAGAGVIGSGLARGGRAAGIVGDPGVAAADRFRDDAVTSANAGFRSLLTGDDSVHAHNEQMAAGLQGSNPNLAGLTRASNWAGNRAAEAAATLGAGTALMPGRVGAAFGAAAKHPVWGAPAAAAAGAEGAAAPAAGGGALAQGAKLVGGTAAAGAAWRGGEDLYNAAVGGAAGAQAPQAADPGRAGGGPAAVAPAAEAPQAAPQAPPSPAPGVPAPAPRPIAPVTRQSLAAIAPEEAAAKGQAADRTLVQVGSEEFRQLPPQQQQETVLGAVGDKITAHAKATGEDPSALLQQARQNAVPPQVIDGAMKSPFGAELGAKAQAQGQDPIAAVTSFFTSPETPAWQKVLAGVGVPLAAIGLASGLFGEGGMGAALMALLGIGGAAAGMGLFSGEGHGPLGGLGQRYGLDQVGTLLGLPGGQAAPQPPPSPAATPGASRMATMGLTPPSAPSFTATARQPGPVAPHPLGGMLADGVIDRAEGQRIMADPALRRSLMAMPLDEQRPAVKAMIAGDPDLKAKLDQARAALSTKGRMFDLSGRAYAAAQQMGLEPQELDALVNASS